MNTVSLELSKQLSEVAKRKGLKVPNPDKYVEAFDIDPNLFYETLIYLIDNDLI
jgi:hypothetical protein